MEEKHKKLGIDNIGELKTFLHNDVISKIKLSTTVEKSLHLGLKKLYAEKPNPTLVEVIALGKAIYSKLTLYVIYLKSIEKNGASCIESITSILTALSKKFNLNESGKNKTTENSQETLEALIKELSIYIAENKENRVCK